MPATEAIRKKLGVLPHKPGIYLMKDRFGTVIYVGKARDLRKRVSQYFHPSRRLGWDLKFNALVEAIHDFDIHVVRSEPEAFLLEGKLIKEFHPRYNISFRDDKRFLMLKVNLNDPIPNFTFTRLKKDDGARYFGPFSNSGALRNTLALVRRQFNLRGCRVFTPGAADYKHCLYAHLKYCTAPCIGNVTRDQYLEQVNAAGDFIAGQCHEMKGQLEAEMRKAAAAQDYEKAAGLRDLIRDLKETTKKERKFERVPYTLPLAIDPQRDLAELAKALGLREPPQRIEGFDISNISGTFAVASLVSFKHGRPDRVNYRRFKIKTVEGQNDFASMAEVVRRRYSRRLSYDDARPDPDRRRQRAAQCRVRGIEETWPRKNSRHRAGEGVRGDLPAGREQTAAAGAGSSGGETAPARARRMSSCGEQLQRAASHQADFGERAGRISRHRRTAQAGAAEKIRLGAAAANGDVGTNRRHPRFRRKSGGGIEKVLGGAVNSDWLTNLPPPFFSKRLFPVRQ